LFVCYGSLKDVCKLQTGKLSVVCFAGAGISNDGYVVQIPEWDSHEPLLTK
jgi:hypothetical protein